MRRTLSLLLLAFLAACGQSSAPQEGQHNSAATARINLGDNPESLDPRRARDLSSSTVCSMLFEGLTRLGPDGKISMGIAQEVESNEDHTQFLFRLRDAKWSDGTAVTAHDFEETWKQILTPRFPASQAFLFYCIKNAQEAKQGLVPVDEVGVRAVNKRTLAVELAYPAPYFTELTAMRSFLPIHQLTDTQNPRWAVRADEGFVSNGPFRLREWRHGDQLMLERNPLYWDADSVKLQQLQLVMVDSNTELSMFEAGEIDWAGSPLSTLPTDALASFKADGKLFTSPAAATAWIRCNTEHAFLAHPKVRRALAYAMDREAIAEHVLQGGQIPALGVVPPSLAVTDVPYFKDSQPELAKRLLTQALEDMELPRDEVPEITLSYASSERNSKVAEALQQQWRRELDLTVQLQSVESKVFWSLLGEKNYDLALGNWFADYRDPSNFLEVFQERGGSNNTGWEDAVYAHLLGMARGTADAEKRRGLMQIAERRLIQAMPVAPIFHFTMNYLRSPRLSGVVISELGTLDFKYAQLEAE